jgi:hypothetical protein
VISRSPVDLRGAFDPAAIFEGLFASHGWKDSWLDGVYDFLHFHTHRHEVREHATVVRNIARVPRPGPAPIRFTVAPDPFARFGGNGKLYQRTRLLTPT